MTPEFPSRLSMIRRIRYSEDALLEFDISTGGLRVKKWPIDRHAERIHLDHLVQYRASHFFQNPCCLCAIPGSQNVIEAAIIVASDGELCNTWVAACASDACGYLAPLAPVHAHPDTEVEFFLRRARRDIQPPVVHVSEINSTARAIGSRETCAVALSKAKAPFTRATSSTLMFTLDCWVRPGISTAEFNQLITQCARCGLVMTRRVFGIHQCARPAERPQMEEFADDNTLFFHMDEV